jgi:hypothetical protein
MLSQFKQLVSKFEDKFNVKCNHIGVLPTGYVANFTSGKMTFDFETYSCNALWLGKWYYDIVDVNEID